MLLFELLSYATFVYALPAAAPAAGPALPFTNPTGQIALLWASIGLAVLTSFLQGFIVTIVTIAEDQGMWTFRFRIARYEHWWWTGVSIMLFASFCLIVFSFLAGNSGNSLGVLTLSTATSIAIVRYTIPAWRNRTYTTLRWLSWTGPSRTGISSADAKFCGNKAAWKRIQNIASRQKLLTAIPSDEWGWAIRPHSGIWQDPTALLQGLDEKEMSREVSTFDQLGCCLYSDGYDNGQTSLLWGENEGFRPRVSRAVRSMPSGLLQSIPSTYDGFNGRGICLAMGILGRNKGLAPLQLVFDAHDRRKAAKGVTRSNPGYKITTELEATSAWYPRPNKVMRSLYQKAVEDQYKGLGDEYVCVAVELALIFLDCPPNVAIQWLEQHLEQQSLEVNQQLSELASPAQLQTLYRASYTSMIISLNYFDEHQEKADSDACRPDLTCFALLWLAEGGDRPEWWVQQWVEARLKAEAKSLRGVWKRAASWLLGLGDIPPLLELENWPVWE